MCTKQQIDDKFRDRLTPAVLAIAEILCEKEKEVLARKLGYWDESITSGTMQKLKEVIEDLKKPR